MSRAVVLCICALGWLLLFAPSAGAATYFGATISGETYGHPNGSHAPEDTAAWNLFERHAGRKVAILNQGQNWATFDKAAMDATRARGTIPLVTMGLPGGMELSDVVNGSQDEEIENWAQAAKAWGSPFLFAPWWEMNGNWYPWGRSPDFIAAWQRFHDLVVAEGAKNVTWTWLVNSVWSAEPLSDPEPYYPGHEYVDWVGMDSYNWGLNPVQPDKWITPEQTIDPTLDVLRQLAPGKPVAIVENAASEFGGNKAAWIREMLTTYLPHHPEIKAYLWFNWNFQQNGKRFDWPIETSAPAQLQFRKAVQSSVFVPGPVSLPALAKVPPPAAPSGDPAQPADISAPAETAAGPDVAVAPDGTATVVWSSRDGGEFEVFARQIAPDGTPAVAQQLSAPGEDALAPQVAVAPDGTATVVWTRSNGPDFQIQGRRITPAGSPEAATRNLSGVGQDALEPQVAVAPDGTATVVWKRFNGSHYLVQAHRIDPEGLLEGSAQTLSETKQNAVEPQVAVASDGTATVVWSRFDGSDSIVQERRVEADGTLEAAVADLSAAGESAVEPRVALDAEGAATVVWTRFDGSSWIIQSRRIGAAGAPEGGTANLSAAGDAAAEPELALTPEGAAVVAWTRLAGGASAVQARRLDPAGAPAGAALTLSATGDAADPRLAIAPDGSATVLWSGFNGSHWVVQRRGVGVGGTLTAIETLSAAGRSAGDPALAWSGVGTLTMAWKRSSGGAHAIQAAIFPKPQLPPPGEDPGDGDDGSGGGAPGGSPSGSPAVTPPRFVDNSFQISAITRNRKRGTATLAVVVPGAGELTLRGSAPRRRQVTAPAQVLLPVVPKAAQRRALRRKGTLRLRLTVTFAPSGGEANSRTFALRLRGSRPGTNR
jgi:hypothetical protein